MVVRAIGERSGMALTWIRDVTVQLRDGYSVRDEQGHEIVIVREGLTAFDGGFAHIVVPGRTDVQVVPAAAVWRASYPVRPRRLAIRRQPYPDRSRRPPPN
jgi:hypothetical protein